MNERSAGAVVVHKSKFLLLDYGKHWDFPKGKREPGEDEKDTVRREIAEETGITEIDFIPGYRERITYFFTDKQRKIAKEVIFYLVRTHQDKVTLSYEHKAFLWLPYEEALQKLTYKSSQELLRKALPLLTK